LIHLITCSCLFIESARTLTRSPPWPPLGLLLLFGMPDSLDREKGTMRSSFRAFSNLLLRLPFLPDFTQSQSHGRWTLPVFPVSFLLLVRILFSLPWLTLFPPRTCLHRLRKLEKITVLRHPIKFFFVSAFSPPELE